MYNQLERILITKEQLENRVKELGATLSKDYKDKLPLLICVLKGSSLFYTDLVRAMDIHLTFDFMAVSSYGASTRSSGEVKMIKDLDHSIEGRHVIIVEDIVDTGFTLKYLKNGISLNFKNKFSQKNLTKTKRTIDKVAAKINEVIFRDLFEN